MPTQPRWLSEGLAEYLETIETDVSGTPVEVGRPATGQLAWTADAVLGLDRLWAWAGWVDDPVERGRLYASSWMWVH